MKKLLVQSMMCGLILLLGQATVYAQRQTAQGSEEWTSEERQANALEAIKDLKAGVLIIRLPTLQRKIEELTRLSESEKLSKGQRKRYGKLLRQAMEERDRDRKAYMDAFNELYTFSEVLYTSDTSTLTLKRGVESGYFLNEQMEVEPSISIAGRPYFIMKMGTIQQKDNLSGVEAALILNRDFELMRSPFPFYAKTKPFGYAFKDIAAPKKASSNTAKRVAQTFEDKLWIFYNKYVKKGQPAGG